MLVNLAFIDVSLILDETDIIGGIYVRLIVEGIDIAR